jgi:hypothetical protein
MGPGLGSSTISSSSSPPVARRVDEGDAGRSVAEKGIKGSPPVAVDSAPNPTPVPQSRFRRLVPLPMPAPSSPPLPPAAREIAGTAKDRSTQWPVAGPRGIEGPPVSRSGPPPLRPQRSPLPYPAETDDTAVDSPSEDSTADQRIAVPIVLAPPLPMPSSAAPVQARSRMRVQDITITPPSRENSLMDEKFDSWPPYLIPETPFNSPIDEHEDEKIPPLPSLPVSPLTLNPPIRRSMGPFKLSSVREHHASVKEPSEKLAIPLPSPSIYGPDRSPGAESVTSPQTWSSSVRTEKSSLGRSKSTKRKTLMQRIEGWWDLLPEVVNRSGASVRKINGGRRNAQRAAVEDAGNIV